jgi:hypothetical protein
MNVSMREFVLAPARKISSATNTTSFKINNCGNLLTHLCTYFFLAALPWLTNWIFVIASSLNDTSCLFFSLLVCVFLFVCLFLCPCLPCNWPFGCWVSTLINKELNWFIIRTFLQISQSRTDSLEWPRWTLWVPKFFGVTLRCFLE